MAFHPGNEKLFSKVTSVPVETTWRKYDIASDGVKLELSYRAAEEVDFTGALGQEILTQFHELTGKASRGLWQVRAEMIGGVWIIGSTYRLGEITQEKTK